jgi:hypothetical protein
MSNVYVHEEDLKPLARHHRRFQAAVAAIANEKLGTNSDPQSQKGVQHHVGGVIVNGHEIFISSSYVQDMSAKGPDPSREEQATVEAIYKLAFLYRMNGEAALKRYSPVANSCPPLNGFFKGTKLIDRPRVR